MSDGITDGNQRPSLQEILEEEIAICQQHSITASLSKRDIAEALEMCKELKLMRLKHWHIRQAVDDVDKTEAQRLGRIRSLVAF